MMATRKLCTFRVGGLELALDASEVEEATRHDDITPVPLAGAGVRGLAHVRGRIIPVIELRPLLGLAPAPAGESVTHLVMRSPEGSVSLEVDRVVDVLEAQSGRIVGAPDALGDALRQRLAGALALPDRLVLILDLKKLLGATEAAGPVAESSFGMAGFQPGASSSRSDAGRGAALNRNDSGRGAALSRSDSGRGAAA